MWDIPTGAPSPPTQLLPAARDEDGPLPRRSFARGGRGQHDLSPRHCAEARRLRPPTAPADARLHPLAGQPPGRSRLRRRRGVRRPPGPYLQSLKTRNTLPRQNSRSRTPRPRLLHQPVSAVSNQKAHADFLPGLTRSGTPTLIVKGRCDYLSWSSAQEYLRVLPSAQLLYLDVSGTTLIRMSRCATWRRCRRSC